MAGETITRAHLSEAVYQEVGLSRNESADLVESVLDEMIGALVRGEMVKILERAEMSEETILQYITGVKE